MKAATFDVESASTAVSSANNSMHGGERVYKDVHGGEGKSGERVTSSFSASFNMVNTVIGSGIIGLPYAIQLSGFGLGIFMLTLVAFLSYHSIVMLIKCGMRADKLDYEELSEHLFGRFGYFITLLFMFLTAFGAIVAYVVVIGDTVPLVVELYYPDNVMSSRSVIIALFLTVIVLPLCLIKDLSTLARTSAISIVFDCIIILIVLVVAPPQGAAEGIIVKREVLGTVNPSVFSGVGIMSFAFVCQQSNFIIFRGLKDRSVKAWEKISRGSMFISYALSMTLGVAGYLVFLSKTEANILSNFPDNSGPISGARILLALTMVLTIPLECYVARHCLISIINRAVLETRIIKNKGQPVEEVVLSNCVSTMYRMMIAILVWGSTTAIGLVVIDLGIVLSLTGTIAASMLAFILPATFYFKSFEKEFYYAWMELFYNTVIVPEDSTTRMEDSTKEMLSGDNQPTASTKDVLSKICGFRQFGVPAIMLAFGIVSLVAGLQSIFA